MSRIALLVALVFAALPATAQAYWKIAPDGNPRIVALYNSSEPVELSRCAPGGGPCTPVAWTNTSPSGHEYLPGETPVGTSFELRGVEPRTDEPKPERSPTWQGRVTNVTLPTVTGDVSVAGVVEHVAGTWAGGWGDDHSEAFVMACATVLGTGCVNPPAAAKCQPCTTDPPAGTASGSPAALPPALGGHYLFAGERRVARDTRGEAVEVRALAGWNPDARGEFPPATPRFARSAPVGPIAVPVPPIVADLPSPVASPTATLRTKALRSKGRISVGRVTCAEPCTVAVRVSGGGRKSFVTSFTARGLKAITVPVRRGKLTVRVRVDGELLANGKVRAR